MAAFLHHCPFLKSVPKPALRRTGAALLSLADQCPIITRQITVSSQACLEEKLSVSPTKPKSHQLPTVEQKRLLAQTATQVAVSVSKGCPFVTSQIGMVRASPEVQEDVKEGRHNITGCTRASEPLKSLTDTNTPALVFYRFDEFSVQGFEGFIQHNICWKQHCYPAV